MECRQTSIEQLVRDLEWVIGSPSLIVDDLSPDVQSAQISAGAFSGLPEIQKLQQSLDQCPIHRVGAYFEKLVQFWLEEIRGFEMAAYRQQIREAGRTLGELDFVFRDNAGELQHWEVAVKFYLHSTDESSIDSQWIGPNPMDYFEKKMRRMFEHQLPLSAKLFPDVSRRRAFVKGRIFYHPESQSCIELPEHLSRQHLRGIWIRACELDWLARAGSTFRYKVLRKPFWLAAPPADAENTFTIQEIREKLSNHFSCSHRPLMLAQFETDSVSFREVERIMVVSDRWPRA